MTPTSGPHPSTTTAHVSLFAFLVLFLSNCAGQTADNASDGPSCQGGKCDSVAVEALERGDLSKSVTCAGKLDGSTTSTFFAQDTLTCTVRLGEFVAGGIQSRSEDGSLNEVSLSAAGPNVARIRGDSYPQTFTVYGFANSTVFGGRSIRITGTAKAATRQAMNGLELNASPPFDVDPVSFFVARGVDASVAIVDLRTSVQAVKANSAELETWEYQKLLIGRGAQVPELRAVTLLPVMRGQALSVPAAVRLLVGGRTVMTTTVLTQAGYYRINADATLTLVPASEVPPLRVPAADAGIAPTVDATTSPDGGVAAIDASPLNDVTFSDVATSGDAPAVLATCTPECGSGKVCVFGACRTLSDQREFSCSGGHTTCEENADCTTGHACAAGKCVDLSCQREFSCSGGHRTCEESSDCTSGHNCIAGKCTDLSCQREFSCSGGHRVCAQDGDCTSGHACAAGKCTEISCQREFSCSGGHRVCEETSDCASGHTCIAGKCEDSACR